VWRSGGLAQQRVGRALHGVDASGMVPWRVPGTICQCNGVGGPARAGRGGEGGGQAVEEEAGDRPLALHPPATLTSAVEAEKGRTPLHHAAAATRLPVVYELIKAGADVHIRWLK